MRHGPYVHEAGDGAKIVCYVHASERTRGSDSIFLFSPGFAHNVREYALIGRKYERRGIPTVMLNPRGHGGSETPFSIESASQDIVDVAAYLKRRGYKHVFAVGQSMGGYLNAMALVKDEGRNIDAAILVATPRSLAKYTENYSAWKLVESRAVRAALKLPVGPVLSRLDPDLKKTKDFGGGMQYKELVIGDPLRFKREIEGSPDVIARIQDGFALEIPVFLVYGGADTHIQHEDTFSIEYAFREAAADPALVDSFCVPNMTKEISRSAEEIAEISVQFLEQHFPDYRAAVAAEESGMVSAILSAMLFSDEDEFHGVLGAEAGVHFHYPPYAEEKDVA